MAMPARTAPMSLDRMDPMRKTAFLGGVLYLDSFLESIGLGIVTLEKKFVGSAIRECM